MLNFFAPEEAMQQLLQALHAWFQLGLILSVQPND